jgi:NAD(P)-dependent dehydrogenase (short-subunit alcohol dehydrogenase family)
MASAIVIGAGPGIGAAVVRRLAREGLAVGVVARTRASIEAVAGSLAGGADASDRLTGATADVTDEAGLMAALDLLVATVGVPDLLVYNAALIRRDTVGELSASQQLDAWAVNVVGALTAVAHLAPRMAHVGRGTIVLTGGMPEPMPEVTSLSLGKAGVRALTVLLAKQYESAGIHVATVTVAGEVAPGTAFDPDAIAECYWQLHTQPLERWQREVLYSGVTPAGGQA